MLLELFLFIGAANLAYGVLLVWLEAAPPKFGTRLRLLVRLAVAFLDVPAVGASMQAELGSLAEALGAAIDSANKRRLEGVRVLMLFLELRQGEGFVAEAAPVGLDSGVCKNVARKRVLRAEGLLAVTCGACEFVMGFCWRIPKSKKIRDKDHT